MCFVCNSCVLILAVLCLTVEKVQVFSRTYDYSYTQNYNCKLVATAFMINSRLPCIVKIIKLSDKLLSSKQKIVKFFHWDCTGRSRISKTVASCSDSLVNSCHQTWYKLFQPLDAGLMISICNKSVLTTCNNLHFWANRLVANCCQQVVTIK